MSREPNGKPRSAGDIAREMLRRIEERRQPKPPPDAPPPPPSHHDPKERE